MWIHTSQSHTDVFCFLGFFVCFFEKASNCNSGKILLLICTELFPLNAALEFQQMFIMSLNLFHSKL